MVNYELLNEYSDSVQELKRQCTEAGMSDDEFKKMYFETLKSLESAETFRNSNSRIKTILFHVILCVAFLLVVVNYKTIYSYVACNVQEYIYPGLKILRKVSLPFISLFPSLAELYYETCLLQNPFFSVVDMDCWPCSSVNNVRQVNDPKPVTEHHSAPFMYETAQEIINPHSLQQFYMTNKAILDKESPKILVNNKLSIDPNAMFNHLQSGEKNTYIWKFSSMNVAKILRHLISRPKVVPKFGQSTERFIIVDSSQESFQIPDTECSFSFLISLSDSRTISLMPADECKHQCKSIKIDLKESHLLWYNWWYWRPVVQPSTGNSTYIAHVGSYC